MENIQSYSKEFKKRNCCILIPTYNNASFLESVILDAHSYCNDIIIVNDGSTDETFEILKKHAYITVLTNKRNKGKGVSLQLGFKHAADLGFKYVITMDSDGQHNGKDLRTFLEALDENPEALIIGSRNLKQKNMPQKNTSANVFSNFWFYLETGIKLADTQSGFRLYPIDLINDFTFYTSRYEFEYELLVRCAWNQIDIVSVPIHVIYPENRITHFRPFKDFMRIFLLNMFLVTLALTYYRPRLLYKAYRKKSVKQMLKEVFYLSDVSNIKIACSVAFGIFMGIVPVWGYQLIIGFALAHIAKLNKSIFFIAANISIPPMIPLILYLSYVTGSYVMGNGSWQVMTELSLSSIQSNLKQYLVGSIVFASTSAILIGFLTYLTLLVFKRN